jgi:hypothetical protein
MLRRAARPTTVFFVDELRCWTWAASGKSAHLHLAVVKVGGARLVLALLESFAEVAVDFGDIRRGKEIHFFGFRPSHAHCALLSNCLPL